MNSDEFHHSQKKRIKLNSEIVSSLSTHKHANTNISEFSEASQRVLTSAMEQYSNGENVTRHANLTCDANEMISVDILDHTYDDLDAFEPKSPPYVSQDDDTRSLSSPDTRILWRMLNENCMKLSSNADASEALYEYMRRYDEELEMNDEPVLVESESNHSKSQSIERYVE